jgi:hypothetical protein
VVCTHNRAGALARLLADIARLDPAPAQVVVVDDGSGDGTATLLQRFQADHADLPLVTRHTPGRGLGAARNRGIEEVDVEVVAFTDDDCRLQAGHIAELARWFDDAGMGLDFVGGPVLAASDAVVRVALNEVDGFRFLIPGSLLQPGEVLGANLAVRTSALAAAGGFDPRLGAGTPFRCEEIDLCARLLRRGHRGAVVPAPAVVHDHGRNAAEARALERRDDIARGAYLARRLEAGDHAYLRVWWRRAATRFGWHPRHSREAMAILARELAGAGRWRHQRG